ncbi:MAG: hypothetical protein ACOX8A_07495 [Thermacetogeniaceae bacterium]|jgi:hypothetical protein
MFSIGNCKATVTGDTLHLEIDLARDLGPSKSGKTMMIATTSGNKEIPGTDGAIIGLNIYRKR